MTTLNSKIAMIKYTRKDEMIIFRLRTKIKANAEDKAIMAKRTRLAFIMPDGVIFC